MRKVRSNTKTQAVMSDLGLKISPRHLSYAKTDNRILVNVNNTKMYISAKRAGGQKEMFYAAAGIRNFIEKQHRKPEKGELNRILERAKNAEKSKAIWEKRYINNELKKRKNKNPFRKESPELVDREDGIVIESPKLMDIKEKKSVSRGRPKGKVTFEKIVDHSLKKGIINKRTASTKEMSRTEERSKTKRRLESIGLSMNPAFLSYVEPKLESSEMVLVRITTKEGKQRVSVNVSKSGGEVEAFLVADKVRRYILKTGKKPPQAKLNSFYTKVKAVCSKGAIAIDEQSKKKDRPIPSEVNPPQKREDGSWTDTMITEQQVKSKNTTGIFSKIKMWLFG
jgi:hypothetical protein